MTNVPGNIDLTINNDFRKPFIGNTEPIGKILEEYYSNTNINDAMDRWTYDVMTEHEKIFGKRIKSQVSIFDYEEGGLTDTIVKRCRLCGKVEHIYWEHNPYDYRMDDTFYHSCSISNSFRSQTFPWYQNNKMFSGIEDTFYNLFSLK